MEHERTCNEASTLLFTCSALATTTSACRSQLDRHDKRLLRRCRALRRNEERAGTVCAPSVAGTFTGSSFATLVTDAEAASEERRGGGGGGLSFFSEVSAKHNLAVGYSNVHGRAVIARGAGEAGKGISRLSVIGPTRAGWLERCGSQPQAFRELRKNATGQRSANRRQLRRRQGNEENFEPNLGVSGIVWTEKEK